MDANGRPMRRQRRARPSRGGGRGRGLQDGGGQGRGRGGSGSAAESSLGGRTTTRVLVALGAYVAQDMRDAEGLTRPMLRRAALRLALSRSEPARRLGSAYLRLDPPSPDEVPHRRDVIDVGRPPAAPRTLLAPPDASGPETGGQTPLR